MAAGRQGRRNAHVVVPEFKDIISVEITSPQDKEFVLGWRRGLDRPRTLGDTVLPTGARKAAVHRMMGGGHGADGDHRWS